MTDNKTQLEPPKTTQNGDIEEKQTSLYSAPLFTFSTSKNIICEYGAASRLGEILLEYKIKSALLVTDEGIKQLGLYHSAMQSLAQENIKVTVFSEVQADPVENIVLSAVEVAKFAGVDAIIGFGGGSSMDVAKIVSLLAHPQNDQALADIYGVGNAHGKRLKLIQIPTTAGTGSEVTQVAIVTTGKTTKAGIVTPLFLPDLAILDAQLTMGLPAHVTAATGIDAMVHAIEAYTSKLKKNPMSDMFAKEALRLMSSHIQNAVHTGNDRLAREAMLLGSMLAGQAFANSPVAAVHALAYPLGGHFHIAHGLSNSLVLPHVMRFNLDGAAEYYAELAPIIFPQLELTGNARKIGELLINELEVLIKNLGLPTSLKEMGIPEISLPKLAEDAMLQTRLLVNNPRELVFEDALAIYKAAF